MPAMAPAGTIQDDVRQRLMQEAISLFVERGYAATSVREIVAAAGVSKPALYYYFGSKEGLYLEIMNDIDRQFTALLAEHSATSGSVRRRIRELFVGIFDSVRENRATVRLVYAIYFGPPQGAPFVDFNRFFDVILATVDELLAEGMTSGEISPCNRNDLGWSLLGCYQLCLEEQICRTPPRFDRDGMIRAVDLILDAVASAKEQGPGTRDQGNLAE